MDSNRVLVEVENLTPIMPKKEFKEMGIQCDMMNCQCLWEDETVPQDNVDEDPEDWEVAKPTTSSKPTTPLSSSPSQAVVPATTNFSAKKVQRDKRRKDREERRLATASSVDTGNIEKVHQTEVRKLLYSDDLNKEKRKRDHSLKLSKQKSQKMGLKDKIQQKFLHTKEESTRLLQSSDEEM